jgi:hypothetical protein
MEKSGIDMTLITFCQMTAIFMHTVVRTSDLRLQFGGCTGLSAHLLSKEQEITYSLSQPTLGW